MSLPKVFLSSLLLLPVIIFAGKCPDLAGDLKQKLSSGVTIESNDPTVTRWSEYGAPKPAFVVNVAAEKDVAATVKYAVSKNIQFLAQDGGAGWAKTSTIDNCDVVINMRKLNQVTVSGDKTTLTHGGGAITSEVIDAAYAAGVQVISPNCNCVGNMGAYLGGGYSRLAGKYGLGVDNLLSVNMVNADGDLRTVTEKSDPALWWAIRGAGPNFGVVTSATIKAYEVPQEKNTAWLGGLIFTQDKIEALVTAINNLKLQSQMAIFLYYATSEGEPNVITFPFCAGCTAEEGKKLFASIYALEPVADTTAVTPFNEVNAGGDTFCEFGGRKPAYGSGMAKLDPATWRGIWDDYVAWLKNPGTEASTILMEAYSMDKARSISTNSASFPHRNTINFHGVALPWYTDAALDGEAESFANKVRTRLRATDGLGKDSSYINFAHGDESLEIIYGDSLSKLKATKAANDPKNVFNQWFPLSKGRSNQAPATDEA
ncbi:FAD binding domain-containing protein [Eremomyces bilateralis CBS 781.70]|uniref:FAD binding domain-containing protein n=1 Tax=Eremomyces bilateralis CBS 781.70 TaxID=1392243 RepID=A0A6G1GCW5_9PEZI|nr:FAD binding domain-containing protein [Eremomyces bilateralis CBS 781.70]KAF1815935.1 FAD binding domain-containing protein [Eremomyces bilateralis CBS 781.70]